MSKVSTNFKEVIQQHINKVAANDTLFAETLKKPNKSIDECINYILNYVQESGLNGFTDEEIFSKAIHYFDEDSIIATNNTSNMKVVVNHHVEMTQEEKEEAKKMAIDQLVYEHKKSLKTKAKATKPTEAQTSLFH